MILTFMKETQKYWSCFLVYCQQKWHNTEL